MIDLIPKFEIFGKQYDLYYKKLYESYMKGTLLGKGRTNKTYSVANEDDKVYKTGPDVLKQAEEFKKHPDLFPIVYEIGGDYIVVEKLDISKASKDINDMISYYLDKGISMYKLFNKPGIEIDKYIDLYNMMDKIISTLWDEYITMDQNTNNFGYDKNGILKACDF